MGENPRLDKWKKLYEETSYEKTNNDEFHSPIVKNENIVRQQNMSTVHSIHHYIPVNSPVVYVGFWRRFFAFFIDVVITSLFSLFTDNYWIKLVLVILYCTILTASPLKGTLGKAAIGAIVVDKNGNQISISRSLGRYLSYYISSLVLLFGFIMIGFHGQKKGLHDLICGTQVINKK